MVDDMFYMVLRATTFTGYFFLNNTFSRSVPIVILCVCQSYYRSFTTNARRNFFIFNSVPTHLSSLDFSDDFIDFIP